MRRIGRHVGRKRGVGQRQRVRRRWVEWVGEASKVRAAPEQQRRRVGHAEQRVGLAGKWSQVSIYGPGLRPFRGGRRDRSGLDDVGLARKKSLCDLRGTALRHEHTCPVNWSLLPLRHRQGFAFAARC